MGIILVGIFFIGLALDWKFTLSCITGFFFSSVVCQTIGLTHQGIFLFAILCSLACGILSWCVGGSIFKWIVYGFFWNIFAIPFLLLCAPNRIA